MLRRVQKETVAVWGFRFRGWVDSENDHFQKQPSGLGLRNDGVAQIEGLEFRVNRPLLMEEILQRSSLDTLPHIYGLGLLK